MPDIDRIKAKLAKLIRLSDDEGATDGEIANALRMANEIMAKHQLTRDDIDTDADDPVARVAMGRTTVFCKGANATTWEASLSQFVCEFIGSVGCYTEPKVALRKKGLAMLNGTGRTHGTAIRFYGSADDADAAADLFEELRDAVAMMAVARWGSWARGDGGAYAEGFVSGLSAKHKEAKRQLIASNEQTHALILQSDKTALAIVDKGRAWLKTQHNVKLRKVRRSGASGSGQARGEGIRDGKNYDPQRPAPTPKLGG